MSENGAILFETAVSAPPSTPGVSLILTSMELSTMFSATPVQTRNLMMDHTTVSLRPQATSIPSIDITDASVTPGTVYDVNEPTCMCNYPFGE